jgi:phosphoserine phosphatase
MSDLANIALCVDLDGSLVSQDLFVNAYVTLLKKNFFANVLLLMTWPLKGRAAFKAQVGAKVIIDFAAVRFNQELIEFLQGEKAQGRQIILVTANDSNIARQVAAHLSLFNDVMASDGMINLKGVNKAKALTDRYGQRGFDYVGDDYCDIPVWEQARKVYVVAKNTQFINAVSSKVQIEKVFTLMDE